MTVVYWMCAVFCVLGVTAITVILCRSLRDVDSITERLQRDQMAEMHEFLSPAFSMEDDEDFHEKSGGLGGLRKRCSNAGLLIEYLQALVHQGCLATADVDYAAPIALSVRVYTLAAYIEVPLRVIMPRLPHVSERVATSLYADLIGTIKAILADKNPSALVRLDAVL